MNLPPPTLRLLQDPFEFDQLLLIYNYLWPRNILEIGTADGGTLWCWTHNGKPGVKVTAVSLFDDNKHYKDPRPLFSQWESETQSTITPINGNSTSPEVIEQMAKLGPYDWVFIDGDHSAESVRSDYTNALLMIKRPATIILHDIGFSDTPHLQVGPFWEELEKCNSTMRIVNKPGSLGIGVIFAR